jgi:hypothetical protein
MIATSDSSCDGFVLCSKSTSATVKIGNVPWSPPKNELTVQSSIWWTFLKLWDQMKTTSFCRLSLTCFNKYLNHSKGVIYLWRKVVCFVLFVCHMEISQAAAPLATLLVLSKSRRWVGVHRVGFVMFQLQVKFLNIEQFFQWKFIWIIYRRIWAGSSYCCTAQGDEMGLKTATNYPILKVFTDNHIKIQSIFPQQHQLKSQNNCTWTERGKSSKYPIKVEQEKWAHVWIHMIESMHQFFVQPREIIW